MQPTSLWHPLNGDLCETAPFTDLPNCITRHAKGGACTCASSPIQQRPFRYLPLVLDYAVATHSGEYAGSITSELSTWQWLGP